jgi:hypothetical protein
MDPLLVLVSDGHVVERHRLNSAMRSLWVLALNRAGQWAKKGDRMLPSWFSVFWPCIGPTWRAP